MTVAHRAPERLPLTSMPTSRGWAVAEVRRGGLWQALAPTLPPVGPSRCIAPAGRGALRPRRARHWA
eukprot:5969531-Alexandrium_andersonii.AAC.1